MPQSAAAFTPSHLGGKQTPEGDTQAEVGQKAKLSPRGSEIKEEYRNLSMQLHRPQIKSPRLAW